VLRRFHFAEVVGIVLRANRLVSENEEALLWRELGGSDRPKREFVSEFDQDDDGTRTASALTSATRTVEQLRCMSGCRAFPQVRRRSSRVKLGAKLSSNNRW